MSHGNARLTVHGRRLLVERVLVDRRPVAHVAKELGVSRQCAHRWVRRFRDEGSKGLRIPPPKPHAMRHTAATVLADTGRLDISVISALLGHASLDVTMGYVHPGARSVEHAFAVGAEVWAELSSTDLPDDMEGEEDSGLSSDDDDDDEL